MTKITLKSARENRDFIALFDKYFHIFLTPKSIYTKLSVEKYGNDFLVKWSYRNPKGREEAQSLVWRSYDYKRFEYAGLVFDQTEFQVEFFDNSTQNLF